MRFEGEVSELELIPALVELGSEGFTGALRFENDSIIKIVYFKGGAVLSASTNDRADSIDEILLKSGKVSREHVKQALTKRKDDETLGDALLGLGFITRKELSWARRVQLIGILRSVIAWDAGSYTLVSDYLPKREDGPTFQLEQIVLELVLTDIERSKYDALLDSGAAIFRPSALFEERFPSLGLNQEAAAVVRLINGSRTAAEVVSESTSDAFNVYKLMHALQVLGLLARSSPAFGQAPEPDTAVQPTIEMAMDLGAVMAASKSTASSTDDFDLGPPAGLNLDASRQEPDEPVPSSQPTSGELLPSIDEDLGSETDYDAYKPSIPEGRMPGPVITEEFPTPALDIPQKAAPPAVDPFVRKAAPVLTKTAGRSGSGSRIALVLVGLVIVAAFAYAGYVYFLAPADEPSVATPVVEEIPAGDSESAAPTTQVEGEPPTPSVVEEAGGTETSQEVATPPARPVQQAAPPPRAADGRIAATARTNMAAASQVAFTVQFAILCQESSIENAIKVGGAEFWFVPIDYQGRSCYRALWGRYSTRGEAEQGEGRIPSALRGGKTVVLEPGEL